MSTRGARVGLDLAVARMAAGTTFNVIPDEAELQGAIRTLTPEHRAKVHALIAETAEATARAHGVEASCAIEPGFPVTLCDARAVKLGEKVATGIGGGTEWETLADPIMGAEDFSYVLEKVPGAMFFLGVADHDDHDWRCAWSLHNPRMHVDENAMPHGVAMLAGCALEFLANGFE